MKAPSALVAATSFILWRRRSGHVAFSNCSSICCIQPSYCMNSCHPPLYQTWPHLIEDNNHLSRGRVCSSNCTLDAFLQDYHLLLRHDLRRGTHHAPRGSACDALSCRRGLQGRGGGGLLHSQLSPPYPTGNTYSHQTLGV